MKLHYDHLRKVRPDWAKLVDEALAGNPLPLRNEQKVLWPFSKAAVFSLDALYEFAQAGQQTFVLGPKMQALLTETDCSEIPEEFVRLPYPCFYIHLPETAWEIWGGEKTQWHRVAGVYVEEIKPGLVRLLIWGPENERSSFGDDATLWLIINWADVPRQIEGGWATLDFERYMESVLTDARQDASDLGVEVAEGAARQKSTETGIILTRLVINLILYLNSAEPETRREDKGTAKRKAQAKLGRAKSGGKQAKLARRVENMTEAQVTWIGESVERRPKESTPPTDSSGRAVRWHRRRGHFHGYWVGSRKAPDGTPRKGETLILRWVEPTWVGDMAQGVHGRRRYAFKQDKGGT